MILNTGSRIWQQASEYVFVSYSVITFLWRHLIILCPWTYLQLLKRLVMSMAEHELIEIQVFLCRFRHCKNILVFVESTVGVYSFTEVLAKDMTYATTVDLIYKKEMQHAFVLRKFSDNFDAIILTVCTW